MTSQEQIDRIDQQIDANRRVVFLRLRFNPSMSAHQWQNAWDRCPDLRAIEDHLFFQRTKFMTQRGREAHKAWQAEQRRERAKVRAKAKADLAAWQAERFCKCGLPILPSMGNCEFHAAA